MYEQFGIEGISPLAASAVFALLIGIVFGAAAQRTRFCLRRALVGSDTQERSQALAVWLTALAVGILGTQLAVSIGWIEFSEHRLHADTVPYAAIIVGGLLFGAGMVLTRGCASRLTVLAGSGNLRALFVLVIFAVTVLSTMKGVLSPVRETLSAFSVDPTLNSMLHASSTAIIVLVITFVALASSLAIKSGATRAQLMGGALIGLLVPIAWVGTGYVLQDDFDPIVFQSLSFTSSSADWLFWSIASTSIGAGFGVGLLFGVLIGSAISAISSHQFRWVSFTSPRQTGRYAAGAVLMGVGGVLAGGCTVGAGLSGVSSLSLNAALTLLFIVLGSKAMDALLHAVFNRETRVQGSLTVAG